MWCEIGERGTFCKKFPSPQTPYPSKTLGYGVASGLQIYSGFMKCTPDKFSARETKKPLKIVVFDFF